MPSACWVTAMGSRACVPKLPLVQELLKAVGDLDSIAPYCPHTTHKSPPSRPALAIPSVTPQNQPGLGL